MAILIMSAAVPWMGALMALRSAPALQPPRVAPDVVPVAALLVCVAPDRARRALAEEPSAPGPVLLALELMPKNPAAEALVKKYADVRRQLKKDKNYAALSKITESDPVLGCALLRATLAHVTRRLRSADTWIETLNQINRSLHEEWSAELKSDHATIARLTGKRGRQMLEQRDGEAAHGAGADGDQHEHRDADADTEVQRAVEEGRDEDRDGDQVSEGGRQCQEPCHPQEGLQRRVVYGISFAILVTDHTRRTR